MEIDANQNGSHSAGDGWFRRNILFFCLKVTKHSALFPQNRKDFRNPTTQNDVFLEHTLIFAVDFKTH